MMQEMNRRLMSLLDERVKTPPDFDGCLDIGMIPTVSCTAHAGHRPGRRSSVFQSPRSNRASQDSFGSLGAMRREMSPGAMASSPRATPVAPSPRSMSPRATSPRLSPVDQPLGAKLTRDAVAELSAFLRAVSPQSAEAATPKHAKRSCSGTSLGSWLGSVPEEPLHDIPAPDTDPKPLPPLEETAPAVRDAQRSCSWSSAPQRSAFKARSKSWPGDGPGGEHCVWPNDGTASVMAEAGSCWERELPPEGSEGPATHIAVAAPAPGELLGRANRPAVHWRHVVEM